ncbi:endoplasmic reticulum vesicle transporter-domain-containing protein [Gaertneriomyces semiglobifer]|nr:endoplasmic reticulum vesicle transporter-domain-containing protein [Gaertneriomyces semiglobifer]
MSQLRRRTLGSISAPGSAILDKFKDFDAYAKPIEDFRVKTFSGAAVTLASAVVIFLLVFSEFVDWRKVKMEPSIEVDKARKEKLSINLNITVPHVPCYLLSIDVMDVAGEHQNDIQSSVFKKRLDPNGKLIEEAKGEIGGTVPQAADGTAYCGSCYGAKPPASGCCNTCEDVRNAYAASGWTLDKVDSTEQCIREGYAEKAETQSTEGCNVFGTIQVNKVAGNFHLAPGKSYAQSHMHVHDLAPYQKKNIFHFSHTIHSLSFGKQMAFGNPLDGAAKETAEQYFMYQYYIKVVSTRFQFMNGTVVNTNQFSATEHQRDTNPRHGGAGLPGIFFNYDISPMLVTYTEYQKPFSHFLTDVCAVVGGIFTVAGIVDSFIYTAERTIKKKLDLGKAS